MLHTYVYLHVYVHVYIYIHVGYIRFVSLPYMEVLNNIGFGCVQHHWEEIPKTCIVVQQVATWRLLCSSFWGIL